METLTAGMYWSGDLMVGDATWKFIVSPIPGGAGTANHAGSWIVLAAMVLITLLVLAYIRAAHNHVKRLNATNEQLDAALGNMSQALLMFDSSGSPCDR